MSETLTFQSPSSKGLSMTLNIQHELIADPAIDQNRVWISAQADLVWQLRQIAAAK